MTRISRAALASVVAAFLLTATSWAEPPAAKTDLYGDPLPEGAVARLGTVRLRIVPTWSFAFTPDGQTFFTFHRGGLLRTWEARTGRLKGEAWLDAGNPISDLRAAFSPGGKLLAVDDSESFQVWDVGTRRLLQKLPSHGRSLRRDPAFSPDARTVALPEDNMPHLLRLVDTATGESRVIGKRKGSVGTAAFAPDGKRVLVCESDGISAWGVPTGELIWRGDGEVLLTPITFTPDGRAFLAYDLKRGLPLKVWDTATGKPVNTFKLPNAPGSFSLLSPDGRTLAFWGQRTKEARLWDITEGRELRSLAGVSHLWGFSPDGKTLLGRYPGNAALQAWDVLTGKPLYPDTRPLGHSGSVTRLAYSPDGKLLASASSNDRTLRVWDVASGKSVFIVPVDVTFVGPVAFTPNGKELVSLGAEGKVLFWDVSKKQEVRQLTISGSGGQLLRTTLMLRELRFGSDGKTLFALGMLSTDKQTEMGVTAWDWKSGRRLFERGEMKAVDRSALSPDGRLLLCGDGALREVETGKTHARLQIPFFGWEGSAFSCDGSLVAEPQFVQTADGTRLQPGKKVVSVWEVATGKVLHRLDAGWVQHLAFTTDSRYLLTAGSDGLKVWELATAQTVSGRPNTAHLHDPEDQGGFASSLVVAPDGRTFATGHPDGTILIWDLPHNAPSAAEARPLGAAELNALWGDLAGEDAVKAHAGITRLVGAPNQAVPMVRERLKPVAAVPREKLERLIADLDTPQFAQREAASMQLEELGERAKAALREALTKQPTAEQKRRIEGLLDAPHRSPTGEVLRAIRSVQLLERIGTPESRQLLESLAQGDPHARLTQAAKAAVLRLERLSRP